MDSPPPSSAAAPPQEEGATENAHRTKVVQFMGRTTPILLQNDNGPCPLLAICNALSLKNSLNLSPDISEVSQEKLLSLVAEHLIDSNSNIDNNHTGYIENKHQNIADAIDLLPRLTTGIDVNIKFRRIDDFEFTPECAIFHLLDIPLYHGWIVDPQDSKIADAIGSKSYNTLMEELVSLETQTMDDVDFVAATTAALGIPSPCLSRGQSFDDSHQKARKGDIEEEAELLKVLKLSGEETSKSVADGVVPDVVESAHMDMSELAVHSETMKNNDTDENVKIETPMSDDYNALSNHSVDMKFPGISTQEDVCSTSKTDQENNSIQCTFKESTEACESAVDNISYDPQIESQNIQPVALLYVSPGEDSPSFSTFQDKSSGVKHLNSEVTSPSDLDERRNRTNDCNARQSSSLCSVTADLDSSRVRFDKIDKPDAFISSVDGSEPLYEGEECIMESGTVVYDNQEPIYEGEAVLAKQVDGGLMIDGEFKDGISAKQGELIRNFMKCSASQLTIWGLYCLQHQVKERELCVFFRNNNFNTMLKYDGELYILATDQGYITQPDLVWEKLNEVNGDNLYMTGNFKEFKMEDYSNGKWDEENALASTTEYLANIDSVAPSDSSFNSDMLLAISLQQQEFDQQQEPSASSGSRLVTGSQVSQNSGGSSPSSKQESKSKEKCVVM